MENGKERNKDRQKASRQQDWENEAEIKCLLEAWEIRMYPCAELEFIHMTGGGWEWRKEIIMEVDSRNAVMRANCDGHRCLVTNRHTGSTQVRWLPWPCSRDLLLVCLISDAVYLRPTCRRLLGVDGLYPLMDLLSLTSTCGFFEINYQSRRHVGSHSAQEREGDCYSAHES